MNSVIFSVFIVGLSSWFHAEVQAVFEQEVSRKSAFFDFSDFCVMSAQPCSLRFGTVIMTSLESRSI